MVWWQKVCVGFSEGFPSMFGWFPNGFPLDFLLARMSKLRCIPLSWRTFWSPWGSCQMISGAMAGSAHHSPSEEKEVFMGSWRILVIFHQKCHGLVTYFIGQWYPDFWGLLPWLHSKTPKSPKYGSCTQIIWPTWNSYGMAMAWYMWNLVCLSLAPTDVQKMAGTAQKFPVWPYQTHRRLELLLLRWEAHGTAHCIIGVSLKDQRIVCMVRWAEDKLDRDKQQMCIYIYIL